MDEKTKKLLTSLDDEIDRKCYQINKKKQEQKYQKLILLACILFVTIPFVLILLGINVLSFFIPAAIFFMISVVLISPAIFN